MWSCFKYQETPTKMDDFHILPVEQRWQDTIRFNLKRKDIGALFICQEIH